MTRAKLITGIVAAAVAVVVIAIAAWQVMPLMSPAPVRAEVSKFAASDNGSGVTLVIEAPGTAVADSLRDVSNMPDAAVNGAVIHPSSSKIDTSNGNVAIGYEVPKANLPARSVSFSENSKVIFESYSSLAIADELNRAAGIEEPHPSAPSPGTTTETVTYPDQAHPDSGQQIPQPADNPAGQNNPASAITDLSQLPNESKEQVSQTAKSIFRDATDVTLEGIYDGGDGTYTSTVRSDDPRLDGAMARYDQTGYLRSLVKDGIDYMD